MAALIDGTTPALPPGFALAWGVAPVAANRRGPKPAHTVEEIVAVAIQIADASGFAALSMPGIARKLGLTANALYRYVSSKDELLVLVADTAWGPPPDLARTAHWRTAAGAWTRAVVDRYGVRPWLLDIPVRGAPVTPNLCRWLESLLVALSGTGLTDDDLLGCAVLLDGYARSIASLMRDMAGGAGPTPAVTSALEPLLREQDCPMLAGMLARGGYQDEVPPDGDDIEFGLDRILDGIETLVASRS